jgi:serine/threonine-protein kinase
LEWSEAGQEVAAGAGSNDVGKRAEIVPPSSDDRIGLVIAAGRYELLGRIGQGSMGRVYLARDHRLETDVVLKFPMAAEGASHGPEFLDRFAREIRSLVQLRHPHIVKVIDVGELEGQPYVVMDFLGGGSLKDRMASGPDGRMQPMPPHSLNDWLPEIAKALDFVHAQKHIHRDVKPANILFDRHGHAFLGDFGIIKAITGEEADWRGSSLTAPGFLVGTPNYVAPEIVMGRPHDGRVDQYSLAMTVHEVLSGTNCMEGPTPSATVVNQTMVVPPALAELIPGLPARLSDAILRGLSKEPADRFESCTALAHEVLAVVASTAPPVSPGRSSTPATSRGTPGRVPCPGCQAPMPVGREHVGGRVRCSSCHATSMVSLLSANTVQLKLVEPPSPRQVPPPGAIVLDPPDDEPEPDPSAVTVLVAKPEAPPSTRPPSSATGKLKWIAGLGGLLALLLGGLVVLLAITLGRGPRDGPARAHPTAPGTGSAPSAPQTAAGAPELGPVEINVAYGTEKQRWLEAATAEFLKTPAGQGIKVILHGMGSMEGARAVLDGPKPVPIHVWSPASSAYRDSFEREWRSRHGTPPILKAENLALTPMVFVMWESRHVPFVKKYARVRKAAMGRS